jgi:hypothetical protein
MGMIITNLLGTIQEFFESAGGFILKQLSSTTAPNSGYYKLYAKTDGNLYLQDSDSTETQMATGSAVDKEDLENNLSIIAWDTYTSFTELDDLIVDDFEDEEAIDTNLSQNYLYNGGSDYYSPSVLDTPFWLVCSAFEASTINPSTAYCVVKLQPQEIYTLGSDFEFYVSTDDGAHFTEFPSLSIFNEIGTYDFIRGDVSALSAYGDQTIRYKIGSPTGNNVRVCAVSLGVGNS